MPERPLTVVPAIVKRLTLAPSYNSRLALSTLTMLPRGKLLLNESSKSSVHYLYTHKAVTI